MSQTRRFHADPDPALTTHTNFFDDPAGRVPPPPVNPAGCKGSLATALGRSNVHEEGEDVRMEYQKHFRNQYGIKQAAYDTSCQVWFGGHRVADTYHPKETESFAPPAAPYKPWTTEHKTEYINPKAKKEMLTNLTLHYQTDKLITTASKYRSATAASPLEST